jgi:hypothetical protein
MRKKEEKEEMPGDISPLARRIDVLAERLWGRNKSKMKKDLGISHPVLSRVLRGLQEPPGKLLEALAKWPRVNARWLFLGEGEPLSERYLWAGGGRFLPIADCLLPGPPADHPQLLTGTSLPVADAQFSETAYWFRIPPDCPILRAKGHRVKKGDRVKAGDFLMVETGSGSTQNLDRVRGQLCAFTLPDSHGRKVILGEVDASADPDGDRIYFFPEINYPVETYGVLASACFLPTTLSSKEGEENAVQFRIENVVGVCILLNRVL